MFSLAAALCVTVFSAGALLGTMMEYTRPKPPCHAAGNVGMVGTAANCDAVAQRAFMRLLFAQRQLAPHTAKMNWFARVYN